MAGLAFTGGPRRLLASVEGRRVVAGISDQALVSITSAATGLLGTAVLGKSAAGVMLYALLVLTFVQGVGRAFVGDVMLTHVPRFADPAERRRQFQNAHATSATLAGLAMVVLFGIWLFGPRAEVGDLLWGIPVVPAILLQDLSRYTYQTLREQSRALLIDIVWVSTQILCVVLVLAAGIRSGGSLIACWGVGAAAGAAFFYARTRVNPLRGHPVRWLRDTRHLLGWFTATGVLAQTTTLLIGTLVQKFLTLAAFAGFRLVQTLVLQPAQSLVMALNGLLVPRASQLAAARDAAGIRRQTRTVLLINGAIGLLVVAVAAVAAGPVLHWYKHGLYASVIPIAIPIGIQAWVYLMQVPFTVAIRGMHRGRYLFAQYVVFTATSITGEIVGAINGQLVGAVWGLLGGATVGMIVQAAMFLAAYRQLRRAAATPDLATRTYPDPDPEPTAAR